jgi:LSD1 subclass zinc finger protein
LRAGATGYLSKDHSSAELLEGIQQVLRGEICVAKAVAIALLHRAAATPPGAKSSAVPVERFSDRELQIFRLLGLGQSTGQIAKQLCLSVNTIETYRRRLKEKLTLATGAELVRCATCWVQDVQRGAPI